MRYDAARVVPCPLCGRYADPDEPVAMAENGFRGLRCPDCALVYVSPRPHPEAILQIYEHDASQTAARVHVAKTRDAYAQAHARHLLGLLPADHARPGAQVLELGAGGGVLLTAARAQGCEVAAIEPNPVLAAFMSAQGIPCEVAPLSPASFAGRAFDLVVHCNVLSHFDDPVGTLRLLAERLAPSGLMLFETGNFADAAPAFHPLIQATERFQLPEHLTFFGERSLLRLLGAAGLELVALHRYSRVPEKRAPAVLRALGLGGLTNRLRFWLKYRLGALFPKTGRPLSLVVIARRRPGLGSG